VKPKDYRMNVAIKDCTDLVTEQDMLASFSNTNFGHSDFRGLLSQGCITVLAGWHQGHTITCILEELQLITWNRQKGKTKLTAKGGHYVWLAFRSKPGRSHDQ